MIELDGIEYQVQDAETNAAFMITEINNYASANNIKNSKGELIQFEVNWANPLYMLLYGVGVLFNYVQQLLYSAGCSLSLGSSSDRQLLNIAEIANVKRRKATRTSITGTVYAVVEAEEGVESCEITTSLTCTVSTSGGTVIFKPAFDVSIPIGGSAKIILIAQDDGSYSLSENTITTFDENPTGFRTMITEASQPGQVEESISNLRQRLQNRAVSGTAIDRCKDDMMSLEGVSSCNIYFNTSGNTTVLINGCQVGPRQALLFVQGWNADIAKVYWSHLTVECAGSDSEDALEIDYETNGGQLLPVYVIPPTPLEILVYLYFREEITSDVIQSIIDDVMSLSSSLIIGQSLSSGDVIKKVQADFPSYHLLGCTMKDKDNIGNPGYRVVPNSYQLITFNSNDFTVTTGQE